MKEKVAIFLIALAVLLGGAGTVGAADANDTLIANFTLTSTFASSPEISLFGHHSPPGYDTVTIEWLTNFSCNNRVFYGYNISSGNGTWSSWQNGTANPVIILPSLYPGTTYEYQGWSYNPANSSLNDSEPVGAPFPNVTTLTPTVPDISSLIVSNIKTTSATVSWSVNQSTNNRVVYATNANFTDRQYSSWSNGTGTVSIGLSGLSQGTLYYYFAQSYNTYNSSLVDTEAGTFTTTTSDLMTIPEWFGKFLPLYSLMVILVIVLVATIVIGLITRSETVTGEDLKGAATVIIIVAVILTIGVVIMQMFATL